jgi:hypothetical protein
MVLVTAAPTTLRYVRSSGPFASFMDVLTILVKQWIPRKTHNWIGEMLTFVGFDPRFYRAAGNPDQQQTV